MGHFKVICLDVSVVSSPCGRPFALFKLRRFSSTSSLAWSNLNTTSSSSLTISASPRSAAFSANLFKAAALSVTRVFRSFTLISYLRNAWVADACTSACSFASTWSLAAISSKGFLAVFILANLTSSATLLALDIWLDGLVVELLWVSSRHNSLTKGLNLSLNWLASFSQSPLKGNSSSFPIIRNDAASLRAVIVDITSFL